jgi:hypothetical protein
MNLPNQSLKRERRIKPVFAYASGSERLLKLLLAAWLLASLLFAHGCHGNEDHELFGVLQSCVRCER